MVEIKSRLAEAMALRGMKQVELAEKTKIPKSSICQYLSGYVEPKSDRIYLMAKALSVNPVWLMGYENIEIETIPPDSRFNAKIAEYTLKLTEDPLIIKLLDGFYRLSYDQQISVVNLVASMSPDKRS